MGDSRFWGQLDLVFFVSEWPAAMMLGRFGLCSVSVSTPAMVVMMVVVCRPCFCACDLCAGKGSRSSEWTELCCWRVVSTVSSVFSQE